MLVSVYLPATGGKDNITKFCETVDEIYQKHQKTHHFIFGGDLNEDLGNTKTKTQKESNVYSISYMNVNYFTLLEAKHL